MVLTFKLTDGAFTFDENGRIEMVGEKNGFNKDEFLQRLEIRFLTIVLTDRWRPFEGFDLKAITEHGGTYNDVGVGDDDLVRQLVTNTILQDPEVQAVDDVTVEKLGGREWEVTAIFHSIYERAEDITFKTTLLV